MNSYTKTMPTLNQVKRYHKKKKAIPRIIKTTIGKNEVIYGARALNKRFPPFLDRHTTDFDVFSNKPKKDAKQAEKRLDKHMGFNAFRVEPAQHPGTHKVKSNVTGEGVADFTKPDQKIPSDKIGGKRYVKLSTTKEAIRKSLKDPEAKFRHEKDRDALNRILIFEKLRKRVGPVRARQIMSRTIYNQVMRRRRKL